MDLFREALREEYVSVLGEVQTKGTGTTKQEKKTEGEQEDGRLIVAPSEIVNCSYEEQDESDFAESTEESSIASSATEPLNSLPPQAEQVRFASEGDAESQEQKTNEIALPQMSESVHKEVFMELQSEEDFVVLDPSAEQASYEHTAFQKDTDFVGTMSFRDSVVNKESAQDYKVSETKSCAHISKMEGNISENPGFRKLEISFEQEDESDPTTTEIPTPITEIENIMSVEALPNSRSTTPVKVAGTIEATEKAESRVSYNSIEYILDSLMINNSDGETHKEIVFKAI